MSKIELPPLPLADVYRATWDSGWSQYHDASDPLPAVWDDTAPDEVQGFFSGDRLRARDRQIVELCASIVESVNNYDNPMTANDCAAAIRALLADPASVSHPQAKDKK